MADLHCHGGTLLHISINTYTHSASVRMACFIYSTRRSELVLQILTSTTSRHFFFVGDNLFDGALMSVEKFNSIYDYWYIEWV
jgi:hypothetical protein